MDVAGEGERDPARGCAVERAGPVRQQDPKCVFRGRRHPECLLHVVVLRIVGAPVARVVDADQRERRAAALDHVHAVLHEHLAGILHSANDGVLAGVTIVIAEHGDDAERRAQVTEGAHIVRNEGLGDVDHVSRLHNQIGAERVGLPDDLAHLVFRHMDARMHVGQMRDAEAVQPGREIRKHERPLCDRRQPLGVPDAVGGNADSDGAVRIGGAGEELAPGES